MKVKKIHLLRKEILLQFLVKMTTMIFNL